MSIGTDTSAPYSISWGDPVVGDHTLIAIATDDRGLSTASAPVNITLTPLPVPDPKPRPYATVLEIDTTHFTINGEPTFLLGISYFGGLGASPAIVSRRYG